MSILHQLVKHAADLPMWVNVPGMPFNVPIPGERRERLPGMHNWVPIDTIERVSQRMQEGVPAEQILQEERDRTNAGSMAFNGFIGGSVGGLASRLHGGAASMEPIKRVIEEGMTSDALKNLKNIPTPMKVLPVAGAGIGALVSKLRWDADKEQRATDAREAMRGLVRDAVEGRKAMQSVPQ